MDSVCDNAGPREPSKASQAEMKCATVTDIEQEVVECSSVTDVQKEETDATAAGTSGEAEVSVSGGRTTTSAPKPGRESGPLSNTWQNIVLETKVLIMKLESRCDSFSHGITIIFGMTVQVVHQDVVVSLPNGIGFIRDENL